MSNAERDALWTTSVISSVSSPEKAVPPSRRAVLATLWVLALPASLAACSASLLPKPAAPPTRYTLDAPPGSEPAMPAAAKSAIHGVLAVVPMRAAPGFEGRHMLYQQQPQVVAAFARNEWVDTPARLLAPLLVQALQRHGGFAAVLLLPSSASATWRLETELIRLYQDFSVQPSQLRLTLRAVLIDTRSRRAVATREFDEHEPAATDDPAGGAAAAQRASQRVLQALAAFCAAQAE